MAGAPPLHSRKAARLDVSAATPDNFFDEFFSSTGTADKVQVYSVVAVWRSLSWRLSGGGGESSRGWAELGGRLSLIHI